MGHGSKRRRKADRGNRFAQLPGRPRPRNQHPNPALPPRRSFRPDLADLALERRNLLTISNFHASIAPQTLYPANGQYLPVFVTGSYHVTGNRPAQANYQVVDEYRLDQPQANVASHAVPNKPGDYVFAFKTYLQARVASSDTNGRLYTIAVAVTEPNDSTGTTFGIWVPPAGYKPPKPVPHASVATQLSSRGHYPAVQTRPAHRSH